MDKNEERYYKAELHRLKGELTLQQFQGEQSPRSQAEAEECFLKALAVAQKQQAESLSYVPP